MVIKRKLSASIPIPSDCFENNPTLDRQHLAGMPGRQDDGDPIYIFVLGGV